MCAAENPGLNLFKRLGVPYMAHRAKLIGLTPPVSEKYARGAGAAALQNTGNHYPGQGSLMFRRGQLGRKNCRSALFRANGVHRRGVALFTRFGQESLFVGKATAKGNLFADFQNSSIRQGDGFV